MIDSYVRKQDDPIKWKKHLVLVDAGLRDMSDLVNSIHRFYAAEKQDFLEHILFSIKNDKEEYCYIVKLVYLKEFHKLPNIIFYSSEAPNVLKTKLINIDLTNFAEIWYCKNIEMKIGRVFGRLMLTNNELFPARAPQIIEMVWAGSARNIESFPMQNCPYVRISKDNWNSNYTIEKLDYYGAEPVRIFEEINDIMHWIIVYCNKIREFARYVFSCGCSSLSLEFSYYKESFKFIDWDSDNDIRVIL